MRESLRMSERRIISRSTRIFSLGPIRHIDKLVLVACLSNVECLIGVEACKFQFSDPCFQILPSVYVSFACPGSRYSTISTGRTFTLCFNLVHFRVQSGRKIQLTVRQTLCQGNIINMFFVKRNKCLSGNLFLRYCYINLSSF